MTLSTNHQTKPLHCHTRLWPPGYSANHGSKSLIAKRFRRAVPSSPSRRKDRTHTSAAKKCASPPTVALRASNLIGVHRRSSRSNDLYKLLMIDGPRHTRKTDIGTGIIGGSKNRTKDQGSRVLRIYFRVLPCDSVANGFQAGYRFTSSRAMMIRCSSFVPSPIASSSLLMGSDRLQ